MPTEIELPDDWFVDNDGQALVLDPAKVAAEIARLRAEAERLQGKIDRMECEASNAAIERDLAMGP